MMGRGIEGESEKGSGSLPFWLMKINTGKIFFAVI